MRSGIAGQRAQEGAPVGRIGACKRLCEPELGLARDKADAAEDIESHLASGDSPPTGVQGSRSKGQMVEQQRPLRRPGSRSEGLEHDRCKDLHPVGELRESSHGQLLADWVEVFAPVVFQPFRPTAWPTHGSLLLDHLPFRVRALDPSGRRIPAGKVAFDVFCGVGFVAGKPKLWLTEAFTSANPANWSAFLGSLPGYPERALVGPSSWHRFVRAAKAAENESLDRWIAVNQGTIETQFARRALTPHRALDMPLTTAALDQITRPISAALYPRRYALKNRERLNRLLMLLQLHINGDDDVQAYARAIRLHLEANGGRPLAHRRALTDPLNSPSLR